MKILISADIEGVAGLCHWDEARAGHPSYPEFRAQMEAETRAACEAAFAAGAREVLVKDAHATGRNLRGAELPAGVRLVRGWSGHPFSMVQELDEGFDAVLMVGYHARAGSDGNPLAHTMSSSKVASMRWNGLPISEFDLHARAAEVHGVPVVFVSGDEALCLEISERRPAVRTVATKRGVGPSVVSRHPSEVVAEIREEAERALSGDLSLCLPERVDRHRLEIRYKSPATAYAMSFYPGAERSGEDGVAFESSEIFEVLRFLRFVL